MSVLKVLRLEQQTARNIILKLINLDLTSGIKTLKINNLHVQNSGGTNLSNPLIIHYTGSNLTLPIEEITSPFVFYTVDWGDGTVETLIVDSPSHTYASSQLYIIKIYVDTQGIRVQFGQNIPMWQNVSSIPSLGNERLCSYMFEGSGVDFTIAPQITIDLETLWDTSNVTDMDYMFANSNFNGDLNNSWNVSNVVNMSQMFLNNIYFNYDLDVWDTSKVTDMQSMFQGAIGFNGALDAWSHKTSNVINMQRMFQDAGSFNQPLNSWDVSNVVYMNQMFQDSGVFSQNLGDWDVSKVENMEYMFYGTGGSVPGGAFTNDNYKSLRNWDLSSILYMANMFKYQIQIPSYSPATNYSYGIFTTMLYQWGVNSTLHQNVTLGVFVSQGVTDIQYQNTTLKQYYQGLGWFFEQSGTSGTPVDIWSAGSPCSTSQFQFIWEGLSIESITMPITSPSGYTVNWGDGNVDTDTNTHQYTDDGTYVITVTANDWSSTTFTLQGGGNFYYNLYSIPCCGDIKDFSLMFSAITTSTPQIIETLRWWDTSAVTIMKGMFLQCGISLLDLAKWDLSLVTDTSTMFKGATGLVIFEDNTHHWDTSVVTDMTAMFQGCSPTTMTNIYQLKNWSVSSVIDMSDMFTQLIDTQVFTDILNGWRTNGGVQSNVTVGVNASQSAFLAGGLQTYFNPLNKNWVFKDQGGNTVNIWI